MKKLFYFFIFIVVLGAISFFSLNYLHMKRIKIAVNELKSSLADFQIMMEFREQTFDGYSFLNKNSKLKDVEVYSKVGESVLYFAVPEVLISSAFKLPNSLDVIITLPRQLDGYADFEQSITQKLDIEPKYELTIENLEEFKINSHIQKVLSNNSLTDISFKSDDFVFKVKGINSNEQKELFNIKSINVLSEIPRGEDLQWKHNINIDNLNIVLYPRKLVEYLPLNVSNDEILKNIFSKVKIEKTLLKNPESKTTKYDFDIGCFNKVFDLTCKGNNFNEKHKKTGENNNRSDMLFEIKHFPVLVDYVKGIILAIKKEEDNNFDAVKLNEKVYLFKDAVMQNAEHKPDDVISFTVRDINKQTLFQNKLIEDVFATFIERMKAD
jgi:hypothetical protein